MRLSGKKAFITAGAQGIGRSICERFVAEGASVLAVDININLLEKVGTYKISVNHLPVTAFNFNSLYIYECLTILICICYI